MIKKKIYQNITIPAIFGGVQHYGGVVSETYKINTILLAINCLQASGMKLHLINTSEEINKYKLQKLEHQIQTFCA